MSDASEPEPERKRDGAEYGDRTTADEISELVGEEIVRDRDEREAVMVEIPSNYKNKLDKESEQTDQSKWLIMTEALAQYLGGSDLATIPQIEREIEREEQKIERKEQEIDELERKVEMLRDQVRDRRERVDDLRRRKAKIERETDKRIDALDDVLDTMADRGTHADIDVGPVPTLADEWFDGDQTEALSALKSRAVEIDAEIPPEQFSAPSASGAGAGAETTSKQQRQDDEPELNILQRLRGRESESEDDRENDQGDDQENVDEDEAGDQDDGGRREDAEDDAEPGSEPKPGPDQMAVPIRVRADGGDPR